MNREEKQGAQKCSSCFIVYMKRKMYFIRHGKTPANEAGRYLGRTEESLSELGIGELRERVSGGCYPAVSWIAVSPMRRCVETAEMIYPGRTYIPVSQFREIDFGVFEGKNYKELSGDPRYQAWIDSNGMLPFPEGEGRAEFVERCKSGFLNLLEQWKVQRNPEDSLALIVHGGTIMAILSAYAGGDYFDYQCPNGGGYQCVVDADRDTVQINVIGQL